MSETPSSFGIAPVPITTEMERSYLDYAMSVIVARALPDARDGLKPVQRRILFAMKEGGYEQGKPLRKSARIVGDVMSKYHPHGDSAIYDAMVRLAQPFALRLPLVEGQGNFGSMDGDPAAAMRYTEARLAKAATPLLADIDADTVDFRDNYDNTLLEPVVLPARFPHLLVNGGGGIAVGMATNIPPHNLGEVIDACRLLLGSPDVDNEELLKVIPGPDFPTAGIILGRNGIRDAYHGGRGSIKIRSRATVEERKDGRSTIIVSEIPYQVNKSRLMERIAGVARDGIVDDISDLRDESDRHGTRIVIQMKRGAQADIVLNQLYRHTPLQVSFGMNMLALLDGKPKTLSLREILTHFLEFREQTLRRRCAFHLRKAREKAHILLGLAVAVANIDDVIALIRAAPNSADAQRQLMDKEWAAHDLDALVRDVGEPLQGTQYRLSNVQAKAILELRLHRLTGLERSAIRADLEETAKDIRHYFNLLSQRPLLLKLMDEELLDVRANFADARRTEISDMSDDINDEELIQEEDIVVTLSHAGYIKRVPRHVYRAQRHGGKGRTGMKPKEEDWLTHVCDVSTHTPLLFFSSRGIVYRIKAYRLPVGTPQARGKALVNFFPLRPGESITALMPMPREDHLEDGDPANDDTLGENSPPANDDTLGENGAPVTNGAPGGHPSPGNEDTPAEDDTLGENGPPAENTAIAKDDDDAIDAPSPLLEGSTESFVIFATASGYVRRNKLSDFRRIAANGKIAVKLDGADRLVAVVPCSGAEDIFLATRAGKCIRFPVSKLRVFASRSSRGVRGIRLGPNDQVIAMTLLPHTDLSVEEREAWLHRDRRSKLSEDTKKALRESESILLALTSQGLGKRTSSHAYRPIGRGGKGVVNIALGEDILKQGGGVITTFPVTKTSEILLVTDNGKIIRCPVRNIRTSSRRTKGVRVFNLDKGSRAVSAAVINQDTDIDAPPTESAKEPNRKGRNAHPDNGKNQKTPAIQSLPMKDPNDR